MSLNLPSKASAGPQCAMLGLAHTALDPLHCNNVVHSFYCSCFTGLLFSKKFNVVLGFPALGLCFTGFAGTAFTPLKLLFLNCLGRM